MILVVPHTLASTLQCLKPLITIDRSTLPLASFLLATLVSTSDGRLDSRYGENPKAKSLLQGHLDQMNMLNVAWRDKSLPRRLCRCRGTIGGQSSITTNYTMGGPSK